MTLTLTLTLQIDDLRRQVARSDQEKMKMKSLLQEQDAELRDHKRRSDGTSGGGGGLLLCDRLRGECEV